MCLLELSLMKAAYGTCSNINADTNSSFSVANLNSPLPVHIMTPAHNDPCTCSHN